jgi:hypothetical protein
MGADRRSALQLGLRSGGAAELEKATLDVRSERGSIATSKARCTKSFAFGSKKQNDLQAADETRSLYSSCHSARNGAKRVVTRLHLGFGRSGNEAHTIRTLGERSPGTIRPCMPVRGAGAIALALLVACDVDPAALDAGRAGADAGLWTGAAAFAGGAGQLTGWFSCATGELFRCPSAASPDAGLCASTTTPATSTSPAVLSLV